MVRTYANVEEMFSSAKKVEKMLGGLGETPLKPFKEE
jgi:hypothetical protein